MRNGSTSLSFGNLTPDTKQQDLKVSEKTRVHTAQNMEKDLIDPAKKPFDISMPLSEGIKTKLDIEKLGASELKEKKENLEEKKDLISFPSFSLDIAKDSNTVFI